MICDNCKRAEEAKDGRTDRGFQIGPCYCATLRSASDKPTAGPTAVPALPSGARPPLEDKIHTDSEKLIASTPIRAASAASRDASADVAAGVPDALDWLAVNGGFFGVRFPGADWYSISRAVASYGGECARAAAAAAYARGRKELEGALRAAVARLEVRRSEAYERARQASHGGSDRLADAYDGKASTLLGVIGELRDLLGSGATDAQRPPSPSGALAGAEEMTTKEKK